MQYEIVRADKAPNKRYHHLVGYIVGEDMVGATTGRTYVHVVWLTKPSVTGDKRQVIARDLLTTIGHEIPHDVILEAWEPTFDG